MEDCAHRWASKVCFQSCIFLNEDATKWQDSWLPWPCAETALSLLGRGHFRGQRVSFFSFGVRAAKARGISILSRGV